MNAQTLFRCFTVLAVIFLQQVSSADKKTLQVEAINGNIYLETQDKTLVQLTQSGKDRNPVLSPNGKTLAFIRETDEHYLIDAPVGYDCNDLYTERLWVGHINGEQKMVGPSTGQSGENSQILDDSVCFSPDGKKIYFLTTSWTTSHAVHSVDIDGSNLKFLIPGNSLQILPRGKYKGYLIVKQHRYFVGEGSFDWYWLFDPNGKEIKYIGPTLYDSTMRVLLDDQ